MAHCTLALALYANARPAKQHGWRSHHYYCRPRGTGRAACRCSAMAVQAPMTRASATKAVAASVLRRTIASARASVRPSHSGPRGLSPPSTSRWASPSGPRPSPAAEWSWPGPPAALASSCGASESEPPAPDPAPSTAVCPAAGASPTAAGVPSPTSSPSARPASSPRPVGAACSSAPAGCCAAGEGCVTRSHASRSTARIVTLPS
mmetsp:Transcript_25648/g.96564  ORF Transcript_25648/g.96564 Transcript_25648/m.96564 type:complete len:206 (-) Transcript_25648:342-959(-)